MFWDQFGGGRTIRPGDALESAEEKAAKEARTRELLAAYKSRVGLTIAPDLKLECEKVCFNCYCFLYHVYGCIKFLSLWKMHLSHFLYWFVEMIQKSHHLFMTLHFSAYL